MTNKDEMRKDYYFAQFSMFFVFAPAFLLLYKEWMLFALIVSVQLLLVILNDKIRLCFVKNKLMLKVWLSHNLTGVFCMLLKPLGDVLFTLVFLGVFLLLFYFYRKAYKINYNNMF